VAVTFFTVSAEENCLPIASQAHLVAGFSAMAGSSSPSETTAEIDKNVEIVGSDPSDPRWIGMTGEYGHEDFS
jgi:hypothetical protein